MDVLQPKYWDFIGDGDLTWKDAMLEQRIYFCKVGSAFLRATFELPPGYVIDVLEGPLVVALGWSDDSEPVSDNERDELVRRMVEPLNRFFRAVDWEEIDCIQTDIQTAPGIDDLKILLQQHSDQEFARQCSAALEDSISNHQIRVRLAPSAVLAASVYERHEMRWEKETQENKEWGRTIEYSEPFLPALTKLAEAGESVCFQHIKTSTEHHFVIVTDASLKRLVCIESVNDDRTIAKATAKRFRDNLPTRDAG